MNKYIVKKYILANSIHEVFKLEKNKKPDDILLDSESEPKVEPAPYLIGFDTKASDDYYSEYMKRKKKKK